METLTPPLPNRHPPNQHTKGEGSTPDAAGIQLVLEEVLLSPPFCHTQQCQNLLRYIVKHTLAQEEHLLRERVIGAEVFGRRPDYETGDDPVVRIRAAEVRKRLAQFYQSVTDSPSAPEIQIEIPPGSYRASFRWREGARALHESNAALQAATAQPPASTELVPATQPEVLTAIGNPQLPVQSRTRWSARSRGLLALAVAVCLLVAGVVTYRTVGFGQKRTFRQFWQPWISSTKPVIISVGSNAVYRLSDQVTDAYAHAHNLETQGMEFFVPIDPNSTISGRDIQPSFNSFVALGDVAAVSTVVSALTSHDQAFQERFPNDISFAELRDSPTVLVGGFNNPMTIELTKHLPFVLRARNEIDETNPSGASTRHWMLHASNDSHDTEDYAIITRLAESNGDAPVLIVAGMGQYGTLAAAQFVCDPASVAALAQSLPKGWEKQNLQVVLHIRVVDFKAASTDVVAVKTW
ncbi:MAG TPA: hypothetical protein VGN16_10775 [Acidobacteriaceae bacterium]|jgi:hypothetical protein